MPEDLARKIVGKPLTPAVLEEIGALNEFPEPAAGFDPGKNWKHLYRIWLNHGFYGQLNLNAGFIRIERTESESKDRFTLKVEQKSVNWDGIVNTIDAEIACMTDAFATPIVWSYSSRFTDPGGAIVPELSVDHTVRVVNQTMYMDINGKKFNRPARGSMTGDWCLFEAVQRLKFDTSVHLQFDILEGMTVIKKNHRLSYREHHTDNFKNRNIPLYLFYQIGRGVLPYEYWLDRNHRLLMAISGNRVYIMDEHAEETYAEEVEKHRGGAYSWQNKL